MDCVANAQAQPNEIDWKESNEGNEWGGGAGVRELRLAEEEHGKKPLDSVAHQSIRYFWLVR